MDAFMKMQLASDDSDSDYSVSQPSSQEELGKQDELDKRREIQLKREQKRLQRLKELEETAEKDFAKLMRASDAEYSHDGKVTVRDDFMLQFHTKNLDEKPKISSLEEMDHHLTVGGSRITEQEHVEVADYKRQCRSQDDRKNLSSIQQAVDSSKKIKPAVIKTTVTYAGKTFEIENKVDPNSRRYQQHLKKQKRQLGGYLTQLDDLVDSLDAAPKISTIKKSEADWSTFKSEHQLSHILKQGHGYLKQLDFLTRTTWKLHDKSLAAKAGIDNTLGNRD